MKTVELQLFLFVFPVVPVFVFLIFPVFSLFIPFSVFAHLT